MSESLSTLSAIDDKMNHEERSFMFEKHKALSKDYIYNFIFILKEVQT